MNKGLEIIKKKKELLNKQNQDDQSVIIWDFELDTIEKELKALEIIKDKRLDVTLLQDSENLDYYNIDVQNYYTVYEDMYLTQEEYDLLKEVLL